jgi:hypothetical protein
MGGRREEREKKGVQPLASTGTGIAVEETVG